MLGILHEAIAMLPQLLREPENWDSLHITYHPPRVERLWLQHGAHRIFLHRIYPCEEGDALWHPHPWPSAVRIVHGRYEHALSLGEREEGPPRRDPRVLLRSVLTAGSEYALTNRDAWHAVRPLETPVDSVMVVGAPYEPRVAMPEPPRRRQLPLDAARARVLMQQWASTLTPSAGGA